MSIEIHAGLDEVLSFDVAENGFSPDLTTATIELRAGGARDDDATISASGVGDADGHVLVTLTAAQTAGLSFTSYRYQLRITLDGDTDVADEGDLVVVPLFDDVG